MYSRLRVFCLFLLALSVSLPLRVIGQGGGDYRVDFGNGVIVTPDANVVVGGRKSRGSGDVPLALQGRESVVDGQRVVLLQFVDALDMADRAALKDGGVELLRYVDGGAYYASVREDRVSELSTGDLRGLGVRSVLGVEPEWRLDSWLSRALEGDGVSDLPSYAVKGDRVRVTVYRYGSVGATIAGDRLGHLGIRSLIGESSLGSYDVEVTLSEAQALSDEPWVEYIQLARGPQELLNRNAGHLSGVNRIQARDLGVETGMNLTGRGVRIGVWDMNVFNHMDFGHRLHVQESDMRNKGGGMGHGTHVSGSIAGGGILKRSARGMAPAAELYSYNFGDGVALEILEARDAYGISLTSHSYGFSKRINPNLFCSISHLFSYNAAENDWEVDYLSWAFPTLTNVYAAGNEHGVCYFLDADILDGVHRKKNALYVGSITGDMRISSFSNWGPMDDGRVFPTVVAVGDPIVSTMLNHEYIEMSGTSMSTPVVTGMLGLLTERYGQLHGGAEPNSSLLRALVANTAVDLGPEGPDRMYGYGAVNVAEAVSVLDAGHYREGVVTAADSLLRVPIVVGESGHLRVMLSWTDAMGKREYRYGESPLVNDLDLYVEGPDGRRVYPWILNAKDVKATAVRGEDHVSNMEQVDLGLVAPGMYYAVIGAGKGAIRSVKGEQAYSLVWYLLPNGLRLDYPLGGERLGRDEILNVRWSGAAGPVSVEISVDYGKSFTRVYSGVQGNVASIVLKDYVRNFSDGVYVRVLDAQGATVVDKPLTVSPAVSGLNYKIEGEKIQLLWDLSEGAEGYTVFQVDPVSGASEPLKRVAVSSVELTSEDVKPHERLIFEVQAEYPNGVHGVPSGRVLVDRVGDKGRISVLPWKTTFRQTPPMGVTISATNMKYEWYEIGSEYPKQNGNHVLMIESGSNKPRQCDIRISLGEIDPEVKSLYLAVDRVQKVPSSGRSCDQSLSLIYIDSDGNKKHVYCISEKDYTITPGSKIVEGVALWDLTDIIDDIKNRDLILRFTAEKAFHELHLYELSLQTSWEGGVRITSVADFPKGTDYSGELPIKFTVRNQTKKSQEVLLGYQLYNEDGSRPLSAPVWEGWNDGRSDISIGSFNEKRYTFSEGLRFPKSDHWGGKYRLKLMVRNADEPDRLLAQTWRTVVDPGDYFILPKSEAVLGRIRDPAVTRYVYGELYWTDMGGAFGNPLAAQESSVRFLPSTPGNILELEILDADLGKGAGLLIKPFDVTPSGDFGPHFLQSEGLVENADAEGRVFLSHSASGGIVVTYLANKTATPGSGWRAVVREKPRQNLFKLKGMEVISKLNETHAQVKLTVENLTSQDFKNVLVSAKRIDTFFTVEGVLSELPAKGVGEVVVDKVWVGSQRVVEVMGRILTADTEPTDNLLIQRVVRDGFCAPYIEHPDSVYISSIKLNKVRRGTSPALRRRAPGGSVEYYLDQSQPLYAGVSSEDQRLALSFKTTGRMNDFQWPEYGVAVYGVFRDSSFTEMGRIDCAGAKDLLVPLTVPQGVDTGLYRMRIVFTKKSELDACVERMEYGMVVDFLAHLKSDVRLHDDLGIERLEVPFWFSSGEGKSVDESDAVRVHIRNYSPSTQTGFRVAYRVGKGDPVVETVSASVQPDSLLKYEFKKRLEMKEVGPYPVIAYLDNSDVNSENDTVMTLAQVVSPVDDKFYALFLDGKVDGRPELVHAGTLDTAKIHFESQYHAGFEAWICPEEQPLGNIFNGKGVIITTVGDGGPLFGKMEPDAIIVGVGSGQICYTPGDILEYGVWQHLYVEVFSTQPRSVVRVYLNGEPIPVTTLGAGRPNEDNADSKLVIAPNYRGGLAEARIWNYNYSRNVKKIRERMLLPTSALISASTQDYEQDLVAGFSFGEGPGNGASLFKRFDERKDDYHGMCASIISRRGYEAPWVEQTRLFHSVSAEGQESGQYVEDGNYWLLTLPHGSDLEHVRLRIRPQWPGPSFTLEGESVGESLVVDFRNGAVHELKARHRVLGHDMSDAVRVAVRLGGSSEAEILQMSFMPAQNPGLEKSVVVPVPMGDYVDVQGLLGGANVRGLVPHVVVSPGATVYHGESVFESGTSSLDLSRSATLRVVSQNGLVERIYTFRATDGGGARIEWTPAVTELTYGDAGLILDGRVSTPLLNDRLMYRSSDESVVAISGGQLYPVGVGKTTVSCYIPNSAVEPVNMEFTVNPRVLRVVPLPDSISAGQPVPEPMVEQRGLVEPLRRLPVRTSVYLDNMAMGRPWAERPGVALAPGEYSFVTALDEQGMNASLAANYTVEWGKAVLKVKDDKRARSLSFTAIDDKGLAVEKVVVGVKGAVYSELRTDESGEVTFRLQPGLYAYEAELEGYGKQSGTVNLERDEAVTLTFMSMRHTVKYSVEDASHGVIVGDATQEVVHGGGGTEVCALPSRGYRFVSWSDGDRSPVRRETNVVQAIALTAQFESIVYDITFTTEDGEAGGKVKDGPVKWEDVNAYDLSRGTASGAPEIKVEVTPGFTYSHWEGLPGQKDADLQPKYDLKNFRLTSDTTLRVHFEPLAALPFEEKFDDPENAKILSPKLACSSWGAQKTFDADVTVKLDNLLQWRSGKVGDLDLGDGALYFELRPQVVKMGMTAGTHPRSGGFNILSPKFMVPAKPASGEFKLRVTFDYYLSGSKGMKLLCKKQGDKVTRTGIRFYQFAELKASAAGDYTLQKFEKEVDLTDYENGWVRIQLRVENTEVLLDQHLVLAIDNIRFELVQGSTPATFSLYRAGEGGTVDGKSYVRVADLSNAPTVKAVANPGYSFQRWSDGVKAAERKDIEAVDVVALFDRGGIAPGVDPEYVTLVYGVNDTTGVILGLGVQRIQKGERGSAVRAENLHKGYTFSHWDDGLRSISRSDRAVKDAEYTAIFVKKQRVRLVVGDAATRTPVEGATVTVEGFGSAETGPSGAIFVGMAPGRTYAIEISSPLHETYKGIITTEKEQVVVHLKPKRENVVFAVSDAFGRAVTGYPVTIVNAAGEAVASATTDGYGEAHIVLPLGKYLVVAKGVKGFVDHTKEFSVPARGGRVSLFVDRLSNVTFIVKDHTGAVVPEATVSVAGAELKTDKDGRAQDSVTPGIYGYRVEAKGFAEASGRVVVAYSAQEVEVTLSAPRTLRFLITGAAQYGLKDGWVSILGKGLPVTDGKVEIQVGDGVYDYLVSVPGYHVSTGSVEVKGDDAEVKVTLQLLPLRRALFVVEDKAGYALAGASLFVDGVQKTLGRDGRAVVEVRKESVDVRVVMTRFRTLQKVIRIDQDGQVVRLVMEPGRYIGTLNLTIRDADVTVGGAKVRVVWLGDDGVTPDTVFVQSDDQGLASVSGVYQGMVKVAVAAEGYQPYEETLEFGTSDQAAEIQLVAKNVFQRYTPVFADAYGRVTVSPNPFTEGLVIDDAAGVTSYDLLTLSGVRVLGGMGSGASQIGISGSEVMSLPQGVYLLRLVFDDGAVCVYRVVKQ